MTADKQLQKAEGRPGTKFIYITRFEDEPNGESESIDMGSMKNFPVRFIPMNELSEPAR